MKALYDKCVVVVVVAQSTTDQPSQQSIRGLVISVIAHYQKVTCCLMSVPDHTYWPGPPHGPTHPHHPPPYTHSQIPYSQWVLQNYQYEEWVPHGYSSHTMEQTHQVQRGEGCMTQHGSYFSCNISGQDNSGHQEALEDQSPEQKVAEEEETELKHPGMLIPTSHMPADSLHDPTLLTLAAQCAQYLAISPCKVCSLFHSTPCKCAQYRYCSIMCQVATVFYISLFLFTFYSSDFWWP
jgi:hypothetical protein